MRVHSQDYNSLTKKSPWQTGDFWWVSKWLRGSHICPKEKDSIGTCCPGEGYLSLMKPRYPSLVQTLFETKGAFSCFFVCSGFPTIRLGKSSLISFGCLDWLIRLKAYKEACGMLVFSCFKQGFICREWSPLSMRHPRTVGEARPETRGVSTGRSYPTVQL